MLREVLHWLDLKPGLVVVDGTVGAGGHSEHILKAIGPDGRLIGLDRDESMLERAAAILDPSRSTLKQVSYAELSDVLDELEIETVDRVLLDLGLSSDQLAASDRGFGFAGGALDMRFDQRSGRSAAGLLKKATAEQLEQIFRDYGEERRAADIAQAIVAQNRKQPGSLETAEQLVSLVEQVTGKGRRGESHPATRVFQALRIAVNRELDQLERFLEDVLPSRLKSGGRAVVMTFHSLEDRLVKNTFRRVEQWDNLTRKPVTASASEVRLNPRARSAKVRAAERR